MSGALGVHRGGEKVPAVFLVVIVFSEGGGGGVGRNRLVSLLATPSGENLPAIYDLRVFFLLCSRHVACSS